MTKQEKIDKIYEVIADKTLDFGLIFIDNRKNRIISQDYDENGETGMYRCIDDGENLFRTKNIKKIIGKPVLIGDVLDWMREERLIEDGEDRQIKLCMERCKKRLPIEDQDEYCVDFIYSLIEEGTQ